MVERNRKTIRLAGWDYTSNGAYFVTLCAARRSCLFGRVVLDRVVLSPYGTILDQCWQAIPEHFSHINLDSYVIMPNHLHGILVFSGPQDHRDEASSAFGKPILGSLGTVIRSLKSVTTKRINAHTRTSNSVWQRNYFERVIRDDRELEAVREYIVNNPGNWERDEEHPSFSGSR